MKGSRALLVVICVSAAGCPPPRTASTGGRDATVVRRDPALEARLKGLEQPSVLRHTVAKGETVYALSRKYGVTVSAIVAANPGLKPDELKVGQELVIPGAAQPAVTPSGTKPQAVQAPDRGKLRYPAAGTYRAAGGGVSGVEFRVPAGSAVMASADGKVVLAGADFGGLGPTVMVEHVGGMVTLYGALQDTCVAPGQQVRRGEPLGRAGGTGLVFRVYQNSAPVNPAPLLK